MTARESAASPAEEPRAESPEPPDLSEVPEMSGGLTGLGRTSEFWMRVRNLNNDGAVALNKGRYRKGIALLEQAVALTRIPEVDSVPIPAAASAATLAGGARAPSSAPSAPATSAANSATQATPEQVRAGEGLDLRARALGNLAGATEHRGDAHAALALYDQAVEAATGALALMGDGKATTAVLLNAQIAAGQTHLAAGRAQEALAQAAAAEPHLTGLNPQADPRMTLPFTVANLRAAAQLMLGRYEEALAQAQLAIDIATRHDPPMASHAYSTLAAIRQAMGDLDSATQYQTLSGQLAQLGTDAASQQLAVQNAATMAMANGDLQGAQEKFEEAARLAAEVEMPERQATCLIGAASVMGYRGAVGKARAQVGRVIEQLQTGQAQTGRAPLRSGQPVQAPSGPGSAADGERSGHDGLLREAYALLGDLESTRGRFKSAEKAYLGALEQSANAYERCRVDLRRAEMYAEWASVTPLRNPRMELLRGGMYLAVPVLLATEALRERFAPGPDREWWATTVTAPARELAFRLAHAAGDLGLVYELAENDAALATFTLAGVTEGAEASEDGEAAAGPSGSSLFDVGRVFADGDHGVPEESALQEDQALAAGDDAATHARGSYASASFGDDSDARVRFAPPPLVALAPGAWPSLLPWIQAAEERYGVQVRTREVIPTW